jgi:arylsulfatase A-like enzyme
LVKLSWQTLTFFSPAIAMLASLETKPYQRARMKDISLAPAVFMALAITFSSSLPAASAPAAGGKPNILLIVSDDHGYADVGFQGCKDIPTPHLDRLAREGLRCTSGYVTHPYCSPTRAALMTGRYQQRFGHQHNPWFDPNDHREGLPTSERLLPAFLGDAGYATGWIGKWHLGAAPEFSPLKRGFKETFGFIGGGHHFQNWTPNPTQEYNVPILRNGEPVETTNHLTLAFGNEAAAFIRRHKPEPWFLYLAFNAPHTPHEPTADRLARFSSITNNIRRAYAAQVSLMDDAIGTTLAAVRDTRQAERTLVFFFSDNGGPITVNGSINTPLRGAKGDVYEGGVRVPFLVSWPGRLPSGRDYAEPVSSVDVFATALALAGVPMPTDKKYDSVNLLPFLTGEKSGAPHDRLFWRTSRSRWATREGSFKLVRQTGMSDELYDLATDIGETNDLAAAKPEEMKRLGNAMDDWDKELMPPEFPGLEARIQKRAPKRPKPSSNP